MYFLLIMAILRTTLDAIWIGPWIKVINQFFHIRSWNACAAQIPRDEDLISRVAVLAGTWIVLEFLVFQKIKIRIPTV